MDFLLLSSRNLLRHKTRSLLTMLGIAVSVSALFSILSFNRGFEQGLRREVGRTGIHFMVVPSGCAHEVASLVLHGAVIPKFLDGSVAGRLKEFGEVALVSPLLVAQIPNPGRGRVDLIYGMEMGDLRELKPGWNLEGRIPAGEDEVIVGSEVAAHLGVKPGDALPYPNISRTFRVAAVLKKTGSQDDAFLYLPLPTAQAIVKKPSGVTAVGVKVKDPSAVGALTDRLAEQLPGIQIVTMGQVVNSIGNLAASAKVMSLSLALVAIFVSSVGVMNSILMTVFERTREIGMMRAVGASRPDIFRIVLQETVFLSGAGGVFGIAIAALGGSVIEAVVRGFIPYVPSGSMITFDGVYALASVTFSMVLGVLAGLYPAWKAASISPIEAIRG